MNWLSVYYDKSSGVDKEELERKLAAYSYFASRLQETLSAFKDLILILCILFFFIQQVALFLHIAIANESLPTPTPFPSPLLTSVILLITTVILLASAIMLLWYHAAQRAKVEEVVNILAASKRYEHIIDQIQKEILKTLRQGTQENEQPTTS